MLTEVGGPALSLRSEESQVEVQRVLTELGRSQLQVHRVLVQRVPSALRPLELRSSSANCVRKMANNPGEDLARWK